MNLKMRFESKDMKKFLIACIILLFIVALAVSNLYSLTSTGELSGFNPLPAFSSKLISSTILFYIGTLAALLISCKSYFFSFDKGFGFTTEKKSDGYSKWCETKDMKKQLKLVRPTDIKSDYAGIALINDGKKIYVDNSEYHNLVIGSTGSGKTTAIIFPMVELLSKHGESMIITDPKGEIYEKKGNMLKSKGYNIILLNFRDPQKGNAWNPLNLPYKLWKEGNKDKAIELLEDLAVNILYDESNKSGDPFWEKTSADYFSGIVLSLFEDAAEEEINLNSVSLMTTVGEEKIGGSTYIKEYFSTKDPNSSAYINASSTILAPSDTKMSILAVFKQKIKLFASRENLSEMLSYSDFNVDEIGKRKTALFIIVHDEKRTYHSLVTILIKQIYEVLIDVAQKSGGKLPNRTNFLLDEFANMPPLKDVTTMITAARSRAMRFTLIIQNFAQLNEVYGEHNAETIKGNCGNMIYLISTELRALEEISKMCGEVKSEKDEKTTSVPLVTISDLQKLKMNEVIIRRLRLSPFKTKLTPEYNMNWGKTYKPLSINDIKKREIREVKVFNVRDFVKEMKSKKSNELFGSMPDFNSMDFSRPFPDMFPKMPNMNVQENQPKIDVDRILKNIDKKIAEIEAEEKRITEEQESANKIVDTIKSTTQQESKEEFNTVIDAIDSDETNIINPDTNLLENNYKPETIDDLINKIKEKNSETIDDIKPNMELNQTDKYQEVSDDEFFDDFFDE